MLMLSRLRPGGNTTPAYFTDIDSTYKYYSQLSVISTDGIINGYPDGSFGAHNKTTRSEVASRRRGFETQDIWDAIRERVNS